MSKTVNLELVRFDGDEVGTWGRLRAYFGREPLAAPSGGAFPLLWTVEPPWRENLPHLSCVPAGCYRLAHDTYRGRYPNLKLLDVPHRTAVEMHGANLPPELEGCIGPNERLEALPDGRWVGRRSLPALKALLEAIDDRPLGFVSISWQRCPAR